MEDEEEEKEEEQGGVEEEVDEKDEEHEAVKRNKSKITNIQKTSEAKSDTIMKRMMENRAE